MFKKYFFGSLFFIMLTFGYAQQNPVQFSVVSTNDTLKFLAQIEKGWHLYAANLPNPEAGPLPTEIIFEPSKAYTPMFPIIEENGIIEIDEAFGVTVKYYENQTVFKLPFVRYTDGEIACSGTIHYMVCNNETCIPLDFAFSIVLK